MVHSFRRIFSLVKCQKDNMNCVPKESNNAVSVSLEAVIIVDGIVQHYQHGDKRITEDTENADEAKRSKLTATAESIDSKESSSHSSSSQQVLMKNTTTTTTTTTTKASRKDLNDNGTHCLPTFTMLNENNNNNEIESNQINSKNCNATKSRWTNHAFSIWPSSSVCCGCHKYTFAENSTSDDEEDEEDELAENNTVCCDSDDSEQNHCIKSSKSYDLDTGNSQRSRRLLSFVLISISLALVTAAVLVLLGMLLSHSLLLTSTSTTTTFPLLISSVPNTHNTTSDINTSDEDETERPNLLSIGTSTSVSISDIDIDRVTVTLTSASSSSSPEEYERTDDTEVKANELERKRMISRLSWEMINRRTRHHRTGNSDVEGESDNDDTHNNDIIHFGKHRPDGTQFEDSQELVLPGKMIYTSSDSKPSQHQDSSHHPAVYRSNNGKSCCKTQKYTQVIKRDGCEPLAIVNRMCIGQCVSVWVPGLFASFPVCKPSRTSWKTVKLKCGPDGHQVRKVRVERVKRCSCMQIDSSKANVNSPPSSSLNSSSSLDHMESETGKRTDS